MYTQARYFIRTALVHLLAAFIVGAALLINQGLALGLWIGVLLPTFYHLLMVGWVTQLICGVALWMFPVLSGEQPRGPPWMGWATYAGLNSGLLLRVVAEPIHTLAPSSWTGVLLVLSAVLQVGAIWIFVLAIWPRVKGPRVATPRTSVNHSETIRE
jgi:hypothetical protein